MASMLVSCTTVTQPGRIGLLGHAVADFLAQNHPQRELVIVHDGGGAFHQDILALLAKTMPAGIAPPVRVHAESPGLPLGTLRNAAVRHAQGEWVCQWDDDDRYHPRRIELQLAAALETSSDFCFLADQLHWYPKLGVLTWDDWHTESYPFNLVQGTLLGRRASMPRYTELRRGEDTQLCIDILRAGHTVTRLRDLGWCYVYVHHDQNAWSWSHHWAISRSKQRGAHRLIPRLPQLRGCLADYRPAIPAESIHHAGGCLALPAAAPAHLLPTRP